jgi:hypothetical protein
MPCWHEVPLTGGFFVQALEEDMTDHEQQIKMIWETVLGIEVGEDTDFFEAGGHSFHASRVLAAVHDSLGLRPPLASLFDNPRLRDFAMAVAAERKGRESPADG